jgi:hypothetical protein
MRMHAKCEPIEAAGFGVRKLAPSSVSVCLSSVVNTLDFVVQRSIIYVLEETNINISYTY